MEAYAANFICKTSSLGLQYRLFAIPWMTRCRRICSSNDAAKNPKSPVRYVPKISTRTEKRQSRPVPIDGSGEKTLNKVLGPISEKLEVGDDRIFSQNDFVMDEKLHSRDKKPHSRPTLVDGFDKEVENGKMLLQNGFRVERELQNQILNPLGRPTPMDGSNKREVVKGLDANAERFKVANAVMASKNSFAVDKKLPRLARGSARGLTYNLNQESKEESNHALETMDDEFEEDHEEDVEELEMNMEKFHLDQGSRDYGDKEEAEKAAIRLLATRAYTAVELRKKLQGRRFHTYIIDAVVKDFQTRGLMNDCLYAESFARSRWSSSSWGPRRIKQALCKKGVTEVDAEKALKLVFQDGDPSEDQESSLGLSKVSMNQLHVQALKQWARSRDAIHETRKLRIIRWLQYRGFNWAVTSVILKKLESNNLT